MTVDAAIIDFSAALLLRYFRRGDHFSGETPRVDAKRDLDMLRGHWAISGPVRNLVRYVLTHPHEAQSLLTLRIRIDDAVARGRIDARRTWLHRLQSGLPSAIVANEPVRSFNTGPNLLLAWVLREAATYTARLSSWQGPTSPYLAIIEQAQQEIRAVQRLEALREPLRSVSIGQRPGPGAIRSASRSRRQVYRLAVEAYTLLQGVERGDPAAIDRVARSALLGPLEDWRRFELAVGLAVGEALASAVGEPLRINLLAGETTAPIVTAGRFAIYWQQRTSLYKSPDLEPSELLTRSILAAFNLAIGADRPDLLVVDQEADAVVAIVEVKYVAGDTSMARFREAIDQVVRYARGYAVDGDMAPIIARSLVAISRNAPPLVDLSASVPGSIDFDGITRNELSAWAERFSPAQSAFPPPAEPLPA